MAKLLCSDGLFEGWGRFHACDYAALGRRAYLRIVAGKSKEAVWKKIQTASFVCGVFGIMFCKYNNITRRSDSWIRHLFAEQDTRIALADGQTFMLRRFVWGLRQISCVRLRRLWAACVPTDCCRQIKRGRLKKIQTASFVCGVFSTMCCKRNNMVRLAIVWRENIWFK